MSGLENTEFDIGVLGKRLLLPFLHVFVFLFF